MSYTSSDKLIGRHPLKSKDADVIKANLARSGGKTTNKRPSSSGAGRKLTDKQKERLGLLKESQNYAGYVVPAALGTLLGGGLGGWRGALAGGGLGLAGGAAYNPELLKSVLALRETGAQPPDITPETEDKYNNFMNNLLQIPGANVHSNEKVPTLHMGSQSHTLPLRPEPMGAAEYFKYLAPQEQVQYPEYFKTLNPKARKKYQEAWTTSTTGSEGMDPVKQLLLPTPAGLGYDASDLGAALGRGNVPVTALLSGGLSLAGIKGMADNAKNTWNVTRPATTAGRLGTAGRLLATGKGLGALAGQAAPSLFAFNTLLDSLDVGGRIRNAPVSERMDNGRLRTGADMWREKALLGTQQFGREKLHQMYSPDSETSTLGKVVTPLANPLAAPLALHVARDDARGAINQARMNVQAAGLGDPAHGNDRRLTKRINDQLTAAEQAAGARSGFGTLWGYNPFSRTLGGIGSFDPRDQYEALRHAANWYGWR